MSPLIVFMKIFWIFVTLPSNQICVDLVQKRENSMLLPITVSSQFSSVYIYWAVIYFLLFIPFITNVNVNPVHLPKVPQKASPSTIHLHSENILCLSYSDEQIQWWADAAILSCDCGPISGLKIRELSPFCYFSIWSDLTYSLLKSNFICLIDFHLFHTVGNLSHKNVHFLPWGSVK